jgi:hypothetical protein
MRKVEAIIVTNEKLFKKTHGFHAPHNSFVCLKCHDYYLPSLPASLDMMLSMMKTFKKEHNNCKRRTE